LLLCGLAHPTPSRRASENTLTARELVDGIQVHKVATASQSKSHNVWIWNTVFTGCTWSPLTSSQRRARGGVHRAVGRRHSAGLVAAVRRGITVRRR
jgi:hypothetical protein